MKDLILKLEGRRKNLSNSMLQIQGAITMQSKELERNREILNETIGRQKELDEMIAELKNAENK